MTGITMAALLARRVDRPVGRHWPDTVERVPADHRLSPAAYQLVTQTAEQVHADVDEPTGLLDTREVVSTNQWTVQPAVEEPTAVIPAVVDEPDPALADVTRIFTTVMTKERQPR